MDNLDTIQTTSEFLFAVLKGDLQEMTELKDAYYFTSFIDLDLDVLELPDVIRSMTYDLGYPSVSTDILSQYRNTVPDKILGCAVLNENIEVTEFILEHFKPDIITDSDAIICLYHSTMDVFELIVQNYRYHMINKKLYVGESSDIQSFEQYQPIFNRYFTPLNILLWSLFDMSNHRESYNKPVLYRNQQLLKIRYLMNEGACLNGLSNADKPLCFQLLMQKQFRLLDMCLKENLLVFPTNTEGFINKAIQAYNTEMIIYLLYNKNISHIELRSSTLLNHDILISRHLARVMNPLYFNSVTEVIVKGHFVFNGQHYKMNRSDSLERVYNLYMAGVYIHDPRDIGRYKIGTTALKKTVKQIVIDSNSPFSLTTLSKLMVKKVIGPKNHLNKLLKLYDDCVLPKPILILLSEQKFCKRGILPEYWTVPDVVLNRTIAFEPLS